jgi:hypothetical protein
MPSRREVAMNVGIGAVLAIVVLVLCIVLAILGRLETLLAFLIGLLAVARLTR